MNELRKDYLLDRWVIYATGRAKRPLDFIAKREETPVGTCYFCPGNEKTTPPEIGRLGNASSWKVRWFPNKFPATSEEKKIISSGLLTSKSAFGRHEVIVETPVHNQELEELSVDEIASVFDVCASRINGLMKVEGVEYVLVFKNRGRDAGASLAHPHFQVIALPDVPTLVQKEVESSAAYLKKNKTCVMCDVIKEESNTERKIFEDDSSIVFSPYASRFPFEAWIMPKRHVHGIGDLSNMEKKSFALAVKKTLQSLDRMLDRPPYNFYLHVSPRNQDLHFHLELCPKLSIQAGFELGSGMFINTLLPEEAAKHYSSNI